MRGNDPNGVTDLLRSARTPEEQDELWLKLFPGLRQIAVRRIAASGRQQQERPTELVNQVFPVLAARLKDPTVDFPSRGHFFKYARMAMQSSLRDEARKRVAEEILDDNLLLPTASPALHLVIDDALDTLHVQMPRAARAFELRHLFGFSHSEIREEMKQDYRSDASLAADLTRAKRALASLLNPSE